MEPISPELVLVDPELGRTERARLLASARPQGLAGVDTVAPGIDPEPPQGPVLEAQMKALEAQVRTLEGHVQALEAQVPPAASGGWERPRKRFASVVLPISLIANAILIAVAVADTRIVQPNSTPPASVGTTSQRERLPQVPSSRAKNRAEKSATTPKRARPTKVRRTRPGSTGARATVGAVERKVLTVVVQSPAGKLPPALIDQQTGLAKNNLQAVCRRTGGARTFLCVIRRAQHKPNEGLYVRYRQGRDGRGVFTWYPYRTG